VLMDSQPSLPSDENMSRRWARRIERCCCTCATYFPLAFVYGITTWGVWVLINVGTMAPDSPWIGEPSAVFRFR